MKIDQFIPEYYRLSAEILSIADWGGVEVHFIAVVTENKHIKDHDYVYSPNLPDTMQCIIAMGYDL